MGERRGLYYILRLWVAFEHDPLRLLLQDLVYQGHIASLIHKVGT